MTTVDGTEKPECVCQCTGTFTGLSCNVSLGQQLDPKLVPVSPGVGIGITLGTIAAISVVLACLIKCRAMRKMSEARARRMLFIEFADWGLDWITFALAFYAADLRFDNDPDHALRTFILALCVLSTVTWFVEVALFLTDEDKFCTLAQYFNFFHLLLEDGSQVVLYSIVASGNASSGAEDNVVQVILVLAAAIQSLLFFFQKGYELLSESRNEERPALA